MFGVPPQTVVQLLHQVDIVPLVPPEWIEELVSGLQPGEDQDDQEQLKE